MKQRLHRAWAFGRHIPPRKLARRLRLALQRRLSDAHPAQPVLCPTVRLKPSLPAPLFPPRTAGQLHRDGPDWVIRFLGRSERFAEGKIDWMAPGAGSAYQLWRMNLHYMEYLEEADDAGCTALIQAWIADNGIPKPGAWRDGWNAYALSIRVVVWLQQLALRAPRLSPELRNQIEDSLARQVHFLTRTLETDVGGNHLIKNIKALLWAGAAFDGDAAECWRALGLRLLVQELKVQILPDGVHYERSPSYHAQVFADLLECRAVLEAPLPALDTALAQMAQATADLSHPDGFAAQFNDSGLTMAYAPDTCLAAYAAQTGTRPEPLARFAYADAGYFGFRNGRITVIADCGPLAPDDLPAHGHGDMLSFELSLDGQRMIVDQGVYEYVPGARRDASRAAASHNTLSVANTDQADFFGAFRFGRRARVTACHWETQPDAATLIGAHDGYTSLPGAPLHERAFTFLPQGLYVSDVVKGSGPTPQAQIGFLLHPDVTASQLPDSEWQLTGPQGQRLRVACSEPLQLHDAVWWPDMGQEHTTTRLVACAKTGWQDIETRIEVLAGPLDGTQIKSKAHVV